MILQDLTVQNLNFKLTKKFKQWKSEKKLLDLFTSLNIPKYCLQENEVCVYVYITN